MSRQDPPAPAALLQVGSPWLTFLKVVSWIGFGVLLLMGIVQLSSDLELADGTGLEFVFIRDFLFWVLGAFILLAVSMVGINLAQDVSAIRAKLYSGASSNSVSHEILRHPDASSAAKSEWPYVLTIIGIAIGVIVVIALIASVAE
ncbi:MAG: hypothetical protein LBC97_00070 [Bifidobacteriaceae bacterium]|jgi:hypothetical protein|nr:hypothetical protein [Bifidobacteriaceae bacterium]